MNIKTQALNNQLGYLVSNKAQTVNSQKLNNQQGVIASQNSSVDLNVSSLLNNQQGTISAKNQLNLTAYGVDNKQGTLYTAQDNLVLDAQKQALNNQQGQILSGKAFSDRLENEKGGIYLESEGLLNIAKAVNNQAGEILSWGGLSISGYQTDLIVTNKEGKIQAEKRLSVEAKAISEDGHLEAKDLSIKQKDDFNTKNNINAKSTLAIETLGNVVNNHKLSASDKLALTAKV